LFASVEILFDRPWTPIKSEGRPVEIRRETALMRIAPISTYFLTVPFSRIPRISRLNDFSLAGRSVRGGEWVIHGTKKWIFNRQPREPREPNRRPKSKGEL
jgi:hypothetical protein